MCQYGEAAAKAARLAAGNGKFPQDAWEQAISESNLSKKSQDKGCPRNAFLGLCEEGMIKGIKPGDYSAGEKSKDFATEAVRILRKDDSYVDNMTKLWKKVMKAFDEDEDKSQASRMGVVTALWPKWIKNGGNR